MACVNSAMERTGRVFPARCPGRVLLGREVTSRQNACGFRAVVRVALRAAQVATHPVADTAVRLEPEPLVPRSWPTTLHDDVERRRLRRRTEWPSCGTAL